MMHYKNQQRTLLFTLNIYINNYNPVLLRAWQANIEIQFVSNPYACIQYVVSYITKEEREMPLLLRAVSDECKDNSIRDQMRKCGTAFTNARPLSAQETAYTDYRTSSIQV